MVTLIIGNYSFCGEVGNAFKRKKRENKQNQQLISVCVLSKEV